MMLIILITTISALLIGTYTDLRTREVPDWLNYGLIFSGFGIAIIRSLIGEDYSFILESTIGFAFFWGLGALMYYTGQWGGGDSKMVMGLGALIGLPLPNEWIHIPFMIEFTIFAVLAGAVYGLVWSSVLAIKHRKRFYREFKNFNKSLKKIKMLMLVFGVAILILSFFLPLSLKITILTSLILILLSVYMFGFVKTVEKVCMIKYIPVEKLTEGDWIAEDVMIDDKVITGPKDLGIEKAKIKQLLAYKKKSKIDKVLIKEGIPFVPSFLMAYALTFYIDLGFWF